MIAGRAAALGQPEFGQVSVCLRGPALLNPRAEKDAHEEVGATDRMPLIVALPDKQAVPLLQLVGREESGPGRHG